MIFDSFKFIYDYINLKLPHITSYPIDLLVVVIIIIIIIILIIIYNYYYNDINNYYNMLNSMTKYMNMDQRFCLGLHLVSINYWRCIFMLSSA